MAYLMISGGPCFYSRIFGSAMWTFALMIQIGWVHLAWHYAIDGYLAAVITVVIWKASGWLVRKLGTVEQRSVAAEGDAIKSDPKATMAAV